MKFFERAFLFFLICGYSFNVCAQPPKDTSLAAESAIIYSDTTTQLFVRSISIEGNKKTKDYIIRREMRFQEGDTISISSLATLMEESRSLVYNTTLFTEVVILPVTDSAGISFIVSVKEKWYLYPAPQFKLVDRNFNEWLKTYNGDLTRVVYGVKFAHYNFSGRRDQLRFYILTGYARNISFNYTAPYSNSKLTEGFGVAAGFTQNREVGYRTDYRNLVLNYKKDGFVRHGFNIAGAYIIRRGHFNSHVIGISYNYLKVDDSITIKTNGAYLNGNRSSASFIDLSYSYQHIKVDNVSFPLKGHAYGVSVLKRGFGITGGINLFEVNTSASKFIAHGKNWYSSFQISSKVKLPFNQAYINLRALGFGDFYLRGLETYVIDGVATALARYTLKKKIISFNIPVPFRIKAIPKIPFTFFAKTFADAGASFMPTGLNTRLNNRLLYSGGFGIDILTLYDINLKVEYSFNQLGQNGLFLHTKGGF